MSVKIREKRGKLYLDIYQGGKRTWESLHLELTKDKVQNKEIWRLAEICRSKRETQFLTGAWDINDPIAGRVSLVKYLEDHAKNYKNPATVNACLKHIKDFDKGNILLVHLTSKWVEEFQAHLLKQETLSRYTAGFYSRVLRCALNKAVAKGLITKNPANIVQKITAPEAELLFLSSEEVQKLATIKLDTVYGAEIRRAFLFACHTGLRISDIETLTWSKIQTNPMQIIKSQEKTQSNVVVPLSKTAQDILNDGKIHTQTDSVFNLATRNRRASYAHLKNWAEKAGVPKNIGWHTARRTFATMALESGADIVTLAKLLGHVNMSHVAKYAKVTDKLRMNVINALPEIAI